MLFKQPDMVQRAFDHRLGHRGAVFGQNMLFEAAAVDPDADRDVFGIAGVGHRLDTVVVPDVARVDADFIGAGINRRKGSLVIKMDISHNRNLDRFLDCRNHRGVSRRRHRHPHDLAACGGYAAGLGNIPGDIFNRNVEHGLHRNWVVSADRDIADANRPFDFACHRATLLYFSVFLQVAPFRRHAQKILETSEKVTIIISINSAISPAALMPA